MSDQAKYIVVTGVSPITHENAVIQAKRMLMTKQRGSTTTPTQVFIAEIVEVVEFQETPINVTDYVPQERVLPRRPGGFDEDEET